MSNDSKLRFQRFVAAGVTGSASSVVASFFAFIFGDGTLGFNLQMLITWGIVGLVTQAGVAFISRKMDLDDSNAPIWSYLAAAGLTVVISDIFRAGISVSAVLSGAISGAFLGLLVYLGVTLQQRYLTDCYLCQVFEDDVDAPAEAVLDDAINAHEVERSADGDANKS